MEITPTVNPKRKNQVKGRNMAAYVGQSLRPGESWRMVAYGFHAASTRPAAVAADKDKKSRRDSRFVSDLLNT